MARTDTLPHFLTDVADAIRTAEGSSDTIQASQFDTRIEAISGGGGTGGVDFTGLFSGFSGATTVEFPDVSQDIEITNLTGAFAVLTDLTFADLSGLNTSRTESVASLFEGCSSLIEVISFDTSNAWEFVAMFQGCELLETVPVFDTSNATDMSGMFNGCISLTTQSLDNILEMCINATNYEQPMVLAELFANGELDDYYSGVIENLSNYQDFIAAGWTVDY